MQLPGQIAVPPAKPTLIYDGDCNFCRRWVGHWQRLTAESVDYRPFQDPQITAQFPEIPREQLVARVHLIEVDGRVYAGAEAVFRTLAHNPREQWLLDWYEHSHLFARVTEWVYDYVAKHRRFFSFWSRLGWGPQLEPSTHLFTRWLFLRCLAITYLIAFLSLWTQVAGLFGSNGILPASGTMEVFRQEATAAKVGWDRYHVIPTFCWLSASDRSLHVQCAVGTTMALLLLVGLAPVPCLLALWLTYLSLTTVGREFMSFQWDSLLLETGFLAIFLAPLQFRSRLWRAPPPSRLVLWLLRWLLFRLMFESGCVKLLSGDITWHNLTALSFHYETQPLPTWLGWYAHQLPTWFHKACTALMFGTELAIPFLIFAPRRLRHVGCAVFVALQVAILLTGNYGFFNLLTIALCLLLLDDTAFSKLIPARFRTPQPSPATARFKSLNWPRQLTVPLVCVTVAMSLIQFSGLFRARLPWPAPMLSIYRWLAPFRSFNTYGLFAVMTTSRPELIVEGSDDGETWLPYEFRYKPGDPRRRPSFVAPHQPRLDWQMWFAALGHYQQNPWLLNFCFRLLQGSREVLELLERNPFPNAPPRYVRVVVCQYHFTDWRTRRQTGVWWRRQQTGFYLPVLSLRQ